MFTLWIVLLSASPGCLYITDAEHQARIKGLSGDDSTVQGDSAEHSDSDADTDADTDTDTDTDTDADSDTDTDTDTDTDVPFPWDGAWSGDLTIDVETDLLGDDTCTGTAVFTISENKLNGTLSCDFKTMTLLGDQEGTLSGTVGTASGSGTLTFTSGLKFSDTWTATLAEGPPALLTGAFDGKVTQSATEYTYTGSFTPTRAE